MADFPSTLAACISGGPVDSLAVDAARARAAVTAGGRGQIYVVSCGGGSPADWRVCAVLRRHRGRVPSLAWHAGSGRLLSCGYDRAACVWAPADGAWEAQPVVMDSGAMSHGLTAGAWSGAGTKVYVASASSHVCVGVFDTEQRWWVCRVLTAHTDAVTALAAHPTDDTLLASGGLDSSLVLASTLVRKVDGRPEGSAAFGTAFARVALSAWVHAVAWDAGGHHLAVATHDSRVRVLALGEGRRGGLVPRCTVDLDTLPLATLIHLPGDPTGGVFVGGGFAGTPVALRRSAAGDGECSQWTATPIKESDDDCGGASGERMAWEKAEGATARSCTGADHPLGERDEQPPIRALAAAAGSDDDACVGAVLTGDSRGRIRRWSVR